MGDFNFDLLNYETDTGTAGFLNSIVQFGFLPLTHQPTRSTTDRSATITDNIFANNFEHESISGNLLFKISDHLLQSSIIKSFSWIIKPSTTTNMTTINLIKISSKMIFKFKIGQTLKDLIYTPVKNLMIFTGDCLPVWKDMLH